MSDALSGPIRIAEDPMQLLQGKIAIVTGGSQGIGKAVAKCFASHGAAVVTCSRNLQKAQAAAEEILRETGRAIETLRADVTKKSDVQLIVDTVMKRHGRIDILVNNAGIQEFTPFLELDESMWDLHFAINVKGAFLFSQAVARYMIERGGCKIINMSSDSGVSPVPERAAAYCSSKSALIGLTRCIAKDLGSYGIYCNAICPGGIRNTGMLEHYHLAFGGKDQEDAQLAALKKLGQPEDVANVALFLASNLSDHVTGEHLLVTGGDVMSQ
jgi:NAD(P)-dependent dehydrogenase (short-subunit alcohol dehydrogenase family)